MAYDNYPATDENYDFPPEVVNALAKNPGLSSFLKYRGEITQNQSLDSLMGHSAIGSYRMIGAIANDKGLGPHTGALIVLQIGGTFGVTEKLTLQIWVPISGDTKRRSSDSSGVWTSWEPGGWYKGVLEANTDLNNLLDPMGYSIDGRREGLLNLPPLLEGEPSTLDIFKIGYQWTKQVVTDQYNNRYFRIHTGTTWRNGGDWQREESDGGFPTIGVEKTGEWTSLEEELIYLKKLGEHREAEYMEIGKSVQGRPISAVRIGFSHEESGEKRPTVLITAGVHAGERGTREGALRLIRELIQASNLNRFRLGVIVIPNVNPDGYAAWSRTNANGVNLNRDFIENTQPETKAVRALIENENIIGAADLHGGGSGLRVNFVEPDPDRHVIKSAVMERSRRMFDSVWEYILDHGETPWRYPFTDGSDGEGLVGTFHSGIAAVYDVPALLLELPFIAVQGRDDRRLPPRVWMARTASLFAQAVIDVVYREYQAFTAVANSSSYTIPDRHKSDLELSREYNRDTGRQTFTTRFPQVTNGAIYFQRVGSTVFATFYDVDFGDVTEFPSFFYLEGSIPEGFVPPAFTSFAAMSRADGTSTRRIRFQPNGQILIYSAEPGMRFNVTASWVTLQDWPEL